MCRTTVIMSTPKKGRKSVNPLATSYVVAGVVGISAILFATYIALPELFSVSYLGNAAVGTSSPLTPRHPALNTEAYDTKLLELAHVATSSPWYTAFLAGTTTVLLPGATTTTVVARKSWPTQAAYPRDGRALLPFNRIVAYYGNFFSKNMGILGQYPPEEMLPKLQAAVAEWQAADPTTPVIPAIHYIAMVAQASAGADGKYRAKMPDEEIDKALELAAQVNGITFIDLQVGLSSLQVELPKFEKYLQMPTVHLGIDPEFAMQTSGVKPGRVIGTLDADDINFVIEYLAQLVRTHDLPPKVLIVHRFTRDMVTNYKKIRPLPEVQVVLQMDGWGDPERKIGTYKYVVEAEPIQFSGFKLFYKNDMLPPSTRLLTPTEIINLTPAPSYIQYQ